MYVRTSGDCDFYRDLAVALNDSLFIYFILLRGPFWMCFWTRSLIMQFMAIASSLLILCIVQSIITEEIRSSFKYTTIKSIWISECT